MGLIVVESTLVAYAARKRLADWKQGHLHRMMDVLAAEKNDLLEADGAVCATQALIALGYATREGARIVIYTPQREVEARRFFLYRGYPLTQEPWKAFVEKNPGAAYLTTSVLKRTAPTDVQPRFVRVPQLGLTPQHAAEALELLNTGRLA